VDSQVENRLRGQPSRNQQTRSSAHENFSKCRFKIPASLGEWSRSFPTACAWSRSSSPVSHGCLLTRELTHSNASFAVSRCDAEKMPAKENTASATAQIILTIR
jgi:hypothetical protein